MPEPFALLPQSRLDVLEAHRWYEEQEQGLGDRFVQTVDAAIQLIARQPEVAPVHHRHFRRKVLQGFPYVIFYSFQERFVKIVTVLHTSRSPGVWRERLRS